MENSWSTLSGQIIPSVEHSCIQDKLLGLHSQKVQGYVCSWKSSHSVLYQPSNAVNGLHTRWNHLGKDDDFPGSRVWEGYALPWWRVWKNNDYGLPPWVMRPICIYKVFTTEASSDPGEFTTTQCPISPFTSNVPEAYHSEKGSTSA